MPKGATQFKPGQSGNPFGRPQGSFSLKTRVVKYLEDNPEELGEIIKSLATDPKHQELLLRMIDGNPKQQLDMHLDQPPIPIHGGLSTKRDQDL